MTRFEKFKNMDIDEFAELFMGEFCTTMIYDCHMGNISCHDCVKAWLEEEVEN